MRRDGNEGSVNSRGRDDAVLFGPDDDNGTKIPSQVETLVKGTATVTAEYKPIPDLDYLQVLFLIIILFSCLIYIYTVFLFDLFKTSDQLPLKLALYNQNFIAAWTMMNATQRV